MSLRQNLRAAVGRGVARCTPLETQHATRGQSDATGDATATQLHHASPRDCSMSSATAAATGLQLPSCTTPEIARLDATRKFHAEPMAGVELHVARTTPHNMQPGSQTRHRLAAALAAAINRTCDARGDDGRNRAGLLTECAQLTPEAQADLLAHFTIEAARWEGGSAVRKGPIF